MRCFACRSPKDRSSRFSGRPGQARRTILQMIGGFVQPTSGRIRFGSADVTDLPPNKRPCNTIFQDLGLFPHMTVAENVAYGLRLRGVAPRSRDKRVADMLAVVALDGYGARRVHRLSGGQRQRVALARALVLEPSVLLLDEPLTGLDEQLRRQLRDEIGRLHRRVGATFLAVTHNREEALSLSDRTAVLRAGRIEQVGSPRELFETPANAFVARFIGVDAMIRPDTVEPGDKVWTAVISGRRIPCTPPRARTTGDGYLARPPAGTDSHLSGRRGTRARAGHRRRYCLQGPRLRDRGYAADGQSLKFLVPADQQLAPPAVGAGINLVWRPQRALLVAEASTAES